MKHLYTTNKTSKCKAYLAKPFLYVLLFIICSYTSIGQNHSDVMRRVSEDVYMLNEMSIDLAAQTITIPCKVNMSEGLLELILCTNEGKVHESLLVTDVSPLEFQTALLLLGLDPVNEVPDDSSQIDKKSQFISVETDGDSVALFLVINHEGEEVAEALEDFVFDESTGMELQKSTWLFRGAATHASGHVMIDPDITIIATYHDPMALMELNSQSKFNDELFYVNKNKELAVGQAVSLIIQVIYK